MNIYISNGLTLMSAVFKKKQTSADLDSLFDDFEIVDESLPPAPKASEKAPTSTPTASTSGRTRTKLSPEQRAQEFTKVVEFVKPRVGRKPQEKHLEVRNSAWLGMLQLAASEADLMQVVSLMPGWVPSGRKFKDAISESFVRTWHACFWSIVVLTVLQADARS
jgi:hypothetical protein